MKHKKFIFPNINIDKQKERDKICRKYKVDIAEEGWIYSDKIHITDIKNLIKEFDEIENREPGYTKKYWEDFKALNNELFKKFNIILWINSNKDFKDGYYLSVNHKNTKFPPFSLDEIDKIKLTLKYIQDLINLK